MRKIMRYNQIYWSPLICVNHSHMRIESCGYRGENAYYPTQPDGIVPTISQL